MDLQYRRMTHELFNAIKGAKIHPDFQLLRFVNVLKSVIQTYLTKGSTVQEDDP